MADTAITEISALTSELIRIPSVTNNVKAISEAAIFIKEWLSGNGIPTKIIEFRKGFPVVIAETGKGKKSVLLNGHFDVVPEGDRQGWSSSPYSGKITDNVIFGRGSADMKSGLAVFMKLLAELNGKIDYDIIFTAVPDEEVGGFDGSRHLADRYGPDLVLNAEPTRSELVGLGEKGILQLKLVAKGKTAHASLPSLGRNAIMYMVSDLERLSRIGKVRVNVTKDAREMLAVGIKEFGKDVGDITFNPGRIDGGLKANVVPDKCYAEVDMRLPPGISIERALKLSKSLLKHARIESYISAEPNYTEESSLLARKFLKTVKRYAPNARTYIKNGGTDGRYFRWRGIPTISFGPGNNKIIHSYNEYVTFKDIEAAYRAYHDYLLNLSLA
ncbi:MAG: M20 family metallopeptidase [Nitrososphaerota archaeon]|nr:M20 family metallopeptidase [Nitrososphaerota archaeon]